MQQTTATKGIALLCTGHETYMHWAVNMACSLKAVSPNIPIQLVGSGANLEHVRHSGFEKVFDLITPMRWEDYSDAKGSFFPAKAKLMLPGYFDFDTTLYLDVDGVAIKDINPLFEKPDALVMQLNGYYQPGLVEKPANMLWCSSSVIMEHYGIAPGAKIASVNSSAFLYRKNTDAEIVFAKALDNLLDNPIPLEKQHGRWGHGKGQQPDELYLNIAICQTGIYPADEPFLYFRSRNIAGPVLPLNAIQQKHYGLGLYGDERNNHHSIFAVYDAIARKAFEAQFNSRYIKAEYLMKHKLASQRY